SRTSGTGRATGDATPRSRGPRPEARRQYSRAAASASWKIEKTSVRAPGRESVPAPGQTGHFKLDEQQREAGQRRAESDEADLPVAQARDAKEHLAPVGGGEQRHQALEDQHQADRPQPVFDRHFADPSGALKKRKKSDDGSSTSTSDRLPNDWRYASRLR